MPKHPEFFRLLPRTLLRLDLFRFLLKAVTEIDLCLFLVLLYVLQKKKKKNLNTLVIEIVDL